MPWVKVEVSRTRNGTVTHHKKKQRVPVLFQLSLPIKSANWNAAWNSFCRISDGRMGDGRSPCPCSAFVSVHWKLLCELRTTPLCPPSRLRVNPTCRLAGLTRPSLRDKSIPCKCHPASPWWTGDRHMTTCPSPCSPPSAVSGRRASSPSSKLCRSVVYPLICALTGSSRFAEAEFIFQVGFLTILRQWMCFKVHQWGGEIL